MGRTGLPIRLLVGLHFLKHAFGESDESVVERFVENPYWQYFCGFEYFQHTFPLDPTSLVRWRKRIKPEGMEKLLQETIATAQRGDLLRKSDVARGSNFARATSGWESRRCSGKAGTAMPASRSVRNGRRSGFERTWAV